MGRVCHSQVTSDQWQEYKTYRGQFFLVFLPLITCPLNVG